MKEKLQNVFGNQQKIFDKIENTYATKTEINKSCVFNTKVNLDSWLGNKRLFTMPSITGTDSVYNHQYSIIPDEENDGYFAYQLDVLGKTSGASNIELAKITLNPGKYVISKSNYVYVKINDSAITDTLNAEVKTCEINESQELTICLRGKLLIDNYKNGGCYVPDLFIHINYALEDGSTKEDLKAGDLLLVQEENTCDYYWDGEGCVKLADEYIPTFSVWKPGTKYNVGDVVIANYTEEVFGIIGTVDTSMIAICKLQHTSSTDFTNDYDCGINFGDGISDFHYVWEAGHTIKTPYDGYSINPICATYATKAELNEINNEINNKFNTFVGVGTNIDDAEDYHKFFVVIE